MPQERFVIVLGPPGKEFRLIAYTRPEDGEGVVYFDGAIDASGRVRVPVRTDRLVILSPGKGTIPVIFGDDQSELSVALTD